MRAAMRCTAPMNAPGPPPTIPSRMRRFPSPAVVPEIIRVTNNLDLRKTEHAAVRGLIRAGLREIVKRRTGSLNDVVRNERRAFRGALLRALDAAFPFEDGPTVEIVLRELRENAREIYLAIAGRPKRSGAIDPWLIAPGDALPACRIELCVFDVKHFDALVIEVNVLQIIELLQNKMARVEENVAARIIVHAREK